MKTIVIDARMINMSGIGRYIQAVIKALIQSPVTIILLCEKKYIEIFFWFDKVSVVEIHSPIYSISEQIQLFLKTPRCDIFISPNYNVPIYLPQAKKKVVTIHDVNHLVFKKSLTFFQKTYATVFFNIAIHNELIFTVSEFSKSEIIKFTKCDPEKIVVTKLAVDKNHFKTPLNIRGEDIPANIKKYKQEKYILYIGNVKPHKNLRRALRAFEQLLISYPNLKFLIVGKKSNFLTGDKEIFDDVGRNEKLNKSVEFTGFISDFCLSFLYKNAQLFLFPSLYEGFGLPPLEAMYFGCPVLVSKEGALPEICGNAAYYCNAYDYNNIKEAAIDILSNNKLRNELIERGYKKVDEYDWKTFDSLLINSLLTKVL